MDTLLTILHVVVCLLLVGIVLLQHGKGADIGATFGGSSQSLFGTEGPLPLLNKITTAVAVIFMLTSVTLAYFSSQASNSSVMSGVGTNVEQSSAPMESETKPLAEVDSTMETVQETAQTIDSSAAEGSTESKALANEAVQEEKVEDIKETSKKE